MKEEQKEVVIDGVLWRPFSTAPKDGTMFQMRQGKWLPTHAHYSNGVLVHIEYDHTNRPTHWAPVEH